MNFINVESIQSIEEAKITINQLQARILTVEQCLEDLARSVELAAATGQIYLTDSFRRAAEEMLADKIIVPAAGEDQDLQITVVE